MSDLEISLTASNSSGSQTLYFSEVNGEYYFTLCGTYKGTEIQIDFDSMNRTEAEEFRQQVNIIMGN